jgi:hypothetical protein
MSLTPPDMQYFDHDDIWTKPLGLVAADVVSCGGGAGGIGAAGEDGALAVRRYLADELPDKVQVTIGKGGRPGGRNGYVLIVSHRAGEEVS